MMRNILVFVLLTITTLTEIGFAVSIHRDPEGTLLVFEGEDLLRLHASEFDEDGWLAKDSGYRQSCYLQTLPLEIPFQAQLETIVHYEAHWRAGINNLNEISETELARFDLAYEKTNGKPYRESEFVTVADLGELDWQAKTIDFTHARAKTEKTKQIRFKTMLIPQASKNIRAKMCGIAPFASLRVSKIEMRLNHFEDFMTANNFNSNDLMHCYDTGLFLSKCSLAKKNLGNSEHAAMDYKVALEFDCEGHDIEFNLETELSKTRLCSKKGRQEITLTGKQLNLNDSSPEKTLQATFNHGCVLKIHSVEKSISESQRKEFEKKRKELEDLKNNSAMSAKAFSDLNNLAQVMVALKASLKLLNFQAQSQNQWKHAIQNILKTMEANDGDIWEKILHENSLLEKEEKLSILHLRNALQRILLEEVSFHEIAIESILSKVQLEFLLSTLLDKKTLLENDQKYDHFKKLEERARQELKQLWLESKDFLNWELNDEL